jgi:hypothetical protein
MRVNGMQHNTACHWPSPNKWIRNYKVVVSEVSSHAEEPQAYLEADKARDTGRAINLLSLLYKLHCWSQKTYQQKTKLCIFVGRSVCFSRCSCSLEKSEFIVHHNYIRSTFCSAECLLDCYCLDVFASHSVCQWTVWFLQLGLSVTCLYDLQLPSRLCIRCTSSVSTRTECWFPTSQLLQHPPDLAAILKIGAVKKG